MLGYDFAYKTREETTFVVGLEPIAKEKFSFSLLEDHIQLDTKIEQLQYGYQ